ncbi:hypothetical protein AGMMS50239_19030 [Bacteroidia bacterium]|nr:hypothetical protein AGMMS50239_19030 [Bacteroidia bacterium]
MLAMKYNLFLDECGDQNLANFNPDFPVFTLCGILISESDYAEIENQIATIKRKFWNTGKIILHSRDIRKCQNGFEILFDLDVKRQFYQDINAVMQNNCYTIVACSILKDAYIRKYGRLSDVYGLSLSYIIERIVFALDSFKDKNIELSVYAERRGKKEDASLLNYYNEVLDRGTYFVNSMRIKKYFTSFEFQDKKANRAGLQLADLIAYPITRYILDKEAVNLAFNIIESKIYKQNGKQHGLKIFP